MRDHKRSTKNNDKKVVKYVVAKPQLKFDSAVKDNAKKMALEAKKVEASPKRSPEVLLNIIRVQNPDFDTND